MIKRPDICFSVARSLYCCHGFIDFGISARKKPLLILDYDETLTPIVTRPEDALLDENTRELLQKLLARGAKIVIVSGRPINFLKTQFEGLAVDFAAEHGSYIEQDGEAVLSALDESWLPKIEQIFENWTREHPGSHYEKKQNAIAWHYRETTLTGVTADELIAQLPRTVSKTSLRIIHGKKVIEVLPQSINKGTASLLWLSNRSDFVLVAGDDTTDEDMFAVVNSRSGETVKSAMARRLPDTASRVQVNSPHY